MIRMIYLHLYFRVASLILVQSCESDIKVIGKYNITKQKPCASIWDFSV